jgi:hypothetical protein
MSAPYIDRAVSALPLLAASSASPIQVRLCVCVRLWAMDECTSVSPAGLAMTVLLL